MKQRRSVRLAVERLGDPLPRPGDDDRERVPAGPTGPVHDLLDGGSQIGRSLVRARLAGDRPRGRAPRHGGGRARSGRDVSVRIEEGGRMVGCHSFERQRGRVGVLFVDLELYPGLENLRLCRNLHVVESDADDLVEVTEYQLQIAAGPIDTAALVLLGVVGARRDAPFDDGLAIGAGDGDGHVVAGLQLAVVARQPQHVAPRSGEAGGRDLLADIGEGGHARAAHLAPGTGQRTRRGQSVVTHASLERGIVRENDALVRAR